MVNIGGKTKLITLMMESTVQTNLKNEGIQCERTVPKTPEQNGVAGRLNILSLSLYDLCS